MKKILSIVMLLALTVSISACNTNKKTPNLEQVKAICELSTLKCYYNNVAKSEKKKGTGITHMFEADREFWIEYEGCANIGIDMSLVEMVIKNNDIFITLPKAEVVEIGIVDETLNNDSYKISKDSFWNKNKITTEEQQAAVAKAQKKMEETIKENDLIFKNAEKRAKDLIENYIIELGKTSNTTYNIEWKTAK